MTTQFLLWFSVLLFKNKAFVRMIGREKDLFLRNIWLEFYAFYAFLRIPPPAFFGWKYSNTKQERDNQRLPTRCGEIRRFIYKAQKGIVGGLSPYCQRIVVGLSAYCQRRGRTVVCVGIELGDRRRLWAGFRWTGRRFRRIWWVLLYAFSPLNIIDA